MAAVVQPDELQGTSNRPAVEPGQCARFLAGRGATSSAIRNEFASATSSALCFCGRSSVLDPSFAPGREQHLQINEAAELAATTAKLVREFTCSAACPQDVGRDKRPHTLKASSDWILAREIGIRNRHE